MMLFDSSVWINYSIGKINDQTDLLDLYLERNVQVYICPQVLQEVLQGVRNQTEYEKLKATLLEMHFLQLDPYFVAENAANIYRSLRVKGITLNKPNDCAIAFYAIHFNMPLVHNDKDFTQIAAHTKLKIKK